MKKRTSFSLGIVLSGFIISSCASKPCVVGSNAFARMVNKESQVSAEFIKLNNSRSDWLGSKTKIFLRLSYPDGNSVVLDKDFSFGGGEYEWFINEFFWLDTYTIKLSLTTGMNGTQVFIINTNTFAIEEICVE